MPEPTTPQLTETEVAELELRLQRTPLPNWEVRSILKDAVPALIRDWKAMRARIETLTTEWCECGHARDKHQFFSDHDECYECDQASPDLCCEWRPAPRPNENAALREQLAERVGAIDDFIVRTGGNVNDGKERNIERLRQIQSQLAQVTSERDALAQGIADVAIKAGVIDGSMPLTGPQLLMLCEDLSKNDQLTTNRNEGEESDECL